MAENVTTLNNPSVRTINEDNDAFFGITFPLTYKVGAQGFFPRAKTLLEQSKSNIKNLLLTRKGERVAQPKFGTDLMFIIFEQMNDVIGDDIETEIREAMGFWLPYIEVVDVNTTHIENTVRVELDFAVDVNDETAIDTITFEFNGVQ
mgnify:CR=1 FL=1|jgi:phage baseplate assembly protein W